MSMKLLLLGMLVVTSFSLAKAWGSDRKVLLRDVQVLTLKNGGMTTGQRASPIPQLRCVGGSAQGAFNPQIVQCYNRGWDGQDVQWECKADMDNLYRFGEVEVVCEGFDYPDDPYILQGSCGMEYTLEHTKEGRDKQKQGSYSGWFGSSNYQYKGYKNEPSGKWSGIGDLVVLGVVAFVIYAVYKVCISSGGGLEDRQYSSTSSDYPAGGGGGGGWTNPNTGHGRGGYGHGGGDDDASCSDFRRRQPGTGGGFWTGLGLGGLMGYMFGGNGNRGYRDRGYNYGWGGAPGGFGSSHTGYAAPTGPTSSGTRTASGFGGTRRR